MSKSTYGITNVFIEFIVFNFYFVFVFMDVCGVNHLVRPAGIEVLY